MLRSMMHDFRRRPKDLKPEKAQALDELFEKIPVLGQIYHLRWQATAIFDTAPIPRKQNSRADTGGGCRADANAWKKHWAFQPVRKPAAPNVQQADHADRRVHSGQAR